MIKSSDSENNLLNKYTLDYKINKTKMTQQNCSWSVVGSPHDKFLLNYYQATCALNRLSHCGPLAPLCDMRHLKLGVTSSV